MCRDLGAIVAGGKVYLIIICVHKSIVGAIELFWGTVQKIDGNFLSTMLTSPNTKD